MNGVLKDEATYFGDNEKYTGDSGSSTNMWVIEDTYDFIAAASLQYDNDAYMRLVNDIDFNEHSTYKMGFNNKSFGAGYKRRLYGDGHKIKNIVELNGSGVFCFYYMENCDFVNLVQINCTAFPISLYGSGNNGTAKYCNFGMYLSNSPFTPDGYCEGCTFNVKGKLPDDANLVDFLEQDARLTQCHINVDVIMNGNMLFQSSNNSGDSNRFVSSYITGKVINKYDGEVKWCSQASNSYQYFEPTNSYFAFEYEQVTPQNFEITTFHSCFVDGELFSKNGCTVTFNGFSTKYSGAILTTAQAKDVSYLNSIGFLVVPTE